jgi:hypothetical protein
MKARKYAIIAVVGWIVAAFIGTAFLNWSFDPRVWGEGGRGAFLGAVFFISPFAALIGAIWSENVYDR